MRRIENRQSLHRVEKLNVRAASAHSASAAVNVREQAAVFMASRGGEIVRSDQHRSVSLPELFRIERSASSVTVMRIRYAPLTVCNATYIRFQWHVRSGFKQLPRSLSSPVVSIKGLTLQ